MIDELNKAFESRVRLGIMAVLVVNEWVDHAVLKDLLSVTDGQKHCGRRDCGESAKNK